ncbi:type II/IV secretion system protein [Agrobacterium tumefaciens]|uniref:GspE/PulE family protein n=1 Tax=Agrobacterium tumefaciens TaxID=358 RepID=UPI00122FC281|nr:type II/IV secretion system protein [Agrobacterium tumefaciens]
MSAPIPDVEAFLADLGTSGRLRNEAVQRAASAWRATGQAIDIVMRELGLMPEAELAQTIAAFCKYGSILSVIDAHGGFLERVGADFARQNALVPTGESEESLSLVIADPFSRAAIEAIEFLLGRSVPFIVAPRSAIEEFYQARNASREDTDLVGSGDVAGEEDVDRLLDVAREAPIVRFVSRIIHQAVDRKATDIHIEPFEDLVNIRFRMDGVLQTLETAPRSMAAGITSRIKILARLNIAERRLPQDGRLRASIRGQDVDFRVSVTPSVHGETIVLRILDRSNVRLDLSALGYDAKAVATISAITRKPNGIFLVTGPTGSGKTTTLYSILSDINDPKWKFFTVEDPVEYRMKGITQLQVDPGIGLTFASALRSVLRQDPDGILIGEIRDEETARIAVQAALTGHLVLSTLHTNSAAGAVSRLRDMGIESYLLAATLRGIIGQRLVRRVCQQCQSQKTSITCQTCDGSGLAGRQAIYEIMEVNDRLREAISRKNDEIAIKAIAQQAGMRSLREHATALTVAGTTTPEEVSRVIDLEGI